MKLLMERSSRDNHARFLHNAAKTFMDGSSRIPRGLAHALWSPVAHVPAMLLCRWDIYSRHWLARSYHFSFEPNLKWSALYAPAREIQTYLEGVAKKYAANRFMKLSHETTNCRYDGHEAKWHVIFSVGLTLYSTYKQMVK